MEVTRFFFYPGLLDDYFDERWELIKENGHNEMQVAKMKLYGRDRWTKEDYVLLWKIKTGVIQLPLGPLWDPKTHMLGGTNESNKQRGLFNVKRWILKTASGRYLHKHQDPFPDIANPLESPGNAFQTSLGLGEFTPRNFGEFATGTIPGRNMELQGPRAFTNPFAGGGVAPAA